VTPLWGIWVAGALYLDGLPTTRWARNLATNPAATVHLESGDDVLILDGVVDDITTDAELGARVVAAWDAKYRAAHPEPVNRGVFRFRPRSARAWSHASLADGTRWEFDERAS
jgi:hypothetical protein